MAERIDDIISPKAFEQVQKMNADIGLLVKNFESSANAAKLINAALSGSNSMKTVTENIKAAASEVAKLEQAQKKLEFTNSEAGKELANLNYQISEANRLNRALAKEMTSADGSSSKLSAQLIRLRAQFDGMSEALRNSPLGQELAKRINMVDTALKTLDSNTGRFQRNVGNYATATNSLSQVLREMPAFTYSVQTGILGISNNLPILIDQFRATAMAVNETTGKMNGTAGAFKIFASSLLSFPNILTIAIGLFTIFADKIFGSSKATKDATESLQEYEKALNRINKEVEYNNKNIDRNTKFLLSEARARGATAKELSDIEIQASEKKLALIDFELQRMADERVGYERLLSLKKAGSVVIEQSEAELQKALDTISTNAEKLKEQRAEQQVNIEIIKNDRIADENKKQQDKIEEQNKKHQARLLKQAQEAERKKQEKIKEMQQKAKDTLPDLAAEGAAAGSTSGFLSAIMFEPGSENDAKLQESNKNITKYFDDLSEKRDKAFETLPGEQMLLGREQNPEDLPDVKATKLGEELKTYYAKKEKDARLKLTKEEQLKKTQIVVENTAKTVQMAAEIMSIAADIQFQNEMAMIDKRSKALEDSYDEEIKRLERSGMSKEKIEKEKQRLEAQTEAQRKNIDQQRIQAQKRKARADKAADIANIITSTAAAVVGQLAAKPVGPWNIALAAIMGALGAANLTRAIATPLPQFAKGTNSAPGGFAEVGEKGTELVIEPSGKKYLTPNKSTIMNVKKGSKIIPHHELMNQVRLAAMVKLSGQDSVSEMDYGNALIQAVIEQTEEQKRTRRAMERMNTTVIVNDNSSFQKWVTTYCK